MGLLRRLSMVVRSVRGETLRRDSVRGRVVVADRESSSSASSSSSSSYSGINVGSVVVEVVVVEVVLTGGMVGTGRGGGLRAAGMSFRSGSRRMACGEDLRGGGLFVDVGFRYCNVVVKSVVVSVVSDGEVLAGVLSVVVLLLTAGDDDLNSVVKNLSETEIVRKVCADNGAGVTDE